MLVPLVPLVPGKKLLTMANVAQIWTWEFDHIKIITTSIGDHGWPM